MNRFYLRASRPPTGYGKPTLFKKLMGCKWKWWVLFDAATGLSIGEPHDNYKEMVQNLRALRALHREALHEDPVWPEDRVYRD